MDGNVATERGVVITEGQVSWIMERETAEERLAAWEVFAAIAFPDDDAVEYQPPRPSYRGQKLSPVDRAKRDAYNILRGIQRITVAEIERMRFQQQGGESTGSESTAEIPAYQMGEMSFKRYKGAGWNKFDNVKLSVAEQRAIADWKKRIPSEKALREYLEKNYMLQNRTFVLSDAFCAYAYQRLLDSDFRSTRDGRPFKSLNTAIFYIALDYRKKNAEIERAEKAEHAKDVEAENEMMQAIYSTQTPSDYAAIERKRRRRAEKEAEEKLMREKQKEEVDGNARS